MLRKKSGFTLLELIVVVIVIGILASIALPRYMRIAEKGRVAEAKSMLGAIRSAQLRYAAQYGVFTGNASALDVNMQQGRYFTYVAVALANNTDENGTVATVTRTATDNPFGTSGTALYTINISQSGTITGDGQVQAASLL